MASTSNVSRLRTVKHQLGLDRGHSDLAFYVVKPPARASWRRSADVGRRRWTGEAAHGLLVRLARLALPGQVRFASGVDRDLTSAT